MVTIRIPVPTGQAATNLLGVFGLLAVVVAVGGLAGAWWALLAAGVFALALATLAQNRSLPAAASAVGDEVESARLRKRAG